MTYRSIHFQTKITKNNGNAGRPQLTQPRYGELCWLASTQGQVLEFQKTPGFFRPSRNAPQWCFSREHLKDWKQWLWWGSAWQMLPGIHSAAWPVMSRTHGLGFLRPLLGVETRMPRLSGWVQVAHWVWGQGGLWRCQRFPYDPSSVPARGWMEEPQRSVLWDSMVRIYVCKKLTYLWINNT